MNGYPGTIIIFYNSIKGMKYSVHTQITGIGVFFSGTMQDTGINLPGIPFQTAFGT
jgi:hypothetical protein